VLSVTDSAVLATRVALAVRIPEAPCALYRYAVPVPVPLTACKRAMIVTPVYRTPAGSVQLTYSALTPVDVVQLPVATSANRSTGI